MELFRTDDALKNSVEIVAHDLARRHQSKSRALNELITNSINYLIEESPAVMWIAASLGV